MVFSGTVAKGKFKLFLDIILSVRALHAQNLKSLLAILKQLHGSVFPNNRPSHSLKLSDLINLQPHVHHHVHVILLVF